ncbi:MAG TPA: hypothetical protein VFM68_04410 [Candidatus Saccharimonadales bacterium]|nr:hypothetical protein [Candidatus Saccharimonadales bacterium]
MNKDVIYIDVEDDITAIIGKVKDAQQKVVALVPPKRIGVLQSTVNLRLLARAATQNGKHLVIISNNPALIALAAAAKLPIAKNLQSKPEMSEIAALDVDDGDDVIDGAKLPVGELARTADAAPLGTIAVNNPAIESAVSENAAEESMRRAKPPVPGQLPSKPRAKNGSKVPNFSKFRKKLLLIIAAGILLIGFLVWAIFFAPRATVLITARTTDSSVNNQIKLGDDLKTDLKAGTLQTTTQEIKKTETVDFEATGTRDAGEKATGTMELTRTNPSTRPVTVPVGTEFSSAGRTFVSTESATLETSLTSEGFDPGSDTVNVQAVEPGDEYNLSARSYQTSQDGVSAEGSEMSGGTHREITIVTADDIQKATDALKDQADAKIKENLAKEFDDNVMVIEETYRVDTGTPTSNPGVNQEVADGTQPKLTGEITYRLSGVTREEVNQYLGAHFTQQLKDLPEQRTYDNGTGDASFTNVTAADAGFNANIVATAKIGPKIEDEVIKSLAKGKRYGEIQSNIEAIQGVESVDIKFWPFWVKTAPDDVKKIMVEFKLNGSE